jgi:antitoxin PrlF
MRPQGSFFFNLSYTIILVRTGLLLRSLKMSLSTITSKGQTTIPKDVRDRFNLKPGDRLEFVIEGERVYLQPVNRSIKRLSGLLHQPGRPVLTLEQIEASLQQAAIDEAMESFQ